MLRRSAISTTKRHPLPVVVQVGFAGSRHLVDIGAHPMLDEEGFRSRVEAHLMERLKRLPSDLHLTSSHFLCGISQVAIGADTLFSRACMRLEIPQRLLLPQHRDDYLAAVGSDGTPDFPGNTKEVAIELLDSSHVIHERVGSDAAERHDRFEDVNLEIVRISDVLVCLVADDPAGNAAGRPGGTHELIDRAASRCKPVLQITVAVRNGQPDFHEKWHWNLPEQKENFVPPALAEAFSNLSLPDASGTDGMPNPKNYFEALKSFASSQARKRSSFFKRAAVVIIATHVVATICAVIALKLSSHVMLVWLLNGELLLLATGFSVHRYLHSSRAVHVWALSRLVAELTRSVLAIGTHHVYLDYLFNLPFPPFLRSLLRTINVLHLYRTRAVRNQRWEPVRDAYVEKRLTDASGQLEFYRRELHKAARKLRWVRRAFVLFSALAFAATLGKLSVVANLVGLSHDPWSTLFGGLAVVLPVLAVAAMSFAAALDLEARASTFQDVYTFLRIQTRYLQQSGSEREFAKLLLETESRLLGETVNWFSRRSFTGVA